MKRVILFLFVIALTVSANAQFYIQGTMGLTIKSVKFENDYGKGKNSSTGYLISPGFGYQFNQRFALGIDMGYVASKPFGAEVTEQWLVSPYARFTYAEYKDLLSFYVDGVYEYSVLAQDEADLVSNAFGLRQGMSIKLNDRWSLTAQAILFSYIIEDEDDVRATSFAINPTNVSLGIKYSF